MNAVFRIMAYNLGQKGLRILKTGVILRTTSSISHIISDPPPPLQPMLISPGSTCFVSSSNIAQGGGGGVGAKRELIFHTRDRSLVQKQSFLNNFVQDCRYPL